MRHKIFTSNEYSAESSFVSSPTTVSQLNIYGCLNKWNKAHNLNTTGVSLRVKRAATPDQPVSLHGYAPCQFCLRAWFKNQPLVPVSSNKASRKNESGTDCQPENSQHTTGCFILTIFRPHLTPPLPRVPTGVKAKRCCGSFRLACHFVPCHRQNFLFFFFFFFF